MFIWALAVFVSATVYDFVFARYLQANEAGRAVAAGNWSVTTYLVGIIGLSAVLQASLWFIIPECLGLWLGTYLGVKLKEADPDFPRARIVPKSC